MKIFIAAAVTSICVFPPLSGAADDAKPYQLTDGRAVASLERFRECEFCPEMIVMPSGSFMMGAIEGESRNPFDIYGPIDGVDFKMRIRGPDEIDIIPNEHPRHPVEMDIPYAIARNEVTHAEWTACVDDGGCTHVPDHPAINVSYLDVQEYVAWLNAQVGAGVYRLPTEAEWEYAARAGTTTRFAQGDDLTANQANFSRAATENLRRVPMSNLTNRRMPVPIDALDATNGWGVRHMSGNVGELTLSCWTGEHLGLTTDSEYFAYSQSHNSCVRISKGGDFGTAMDGLRPAARRRPLETSSRDFRGFRIVRELTQSKDS